MQFKEINGKDIYDDLFSMRDKQLENEEFVVKVIEQQPEKIKKQRKPKKKN